MATVMTFDPYLCLISERLQCVHLDLGENLYLLREVLHASGEVLGDVDTATQSSNQLRTFLHLL